MILIADRGKALTAHIGENEHGGLNVKDLERFPFPNDHEREVAVQLQQGKEWARLREILDGYHRECSDKEKRTGRGYLIAKYDGIEHVQGDFYIYRMQ